MNIGFKNFDFQATDQTIVIAEIGVNHNGNPDTAKELVDAAAHAGVDVVKFQAFRAAKEISKFAAQAPYQCGKNSSSGNQLEMCRALELSGLALKEMKEYCTAVNKPFLCAAFDFDSVDLLVDELKVDTIKVASSEITNYPLLEYIGSRKKAVILSTGASSLVEVGRAIEVLQTAGCPELVLFHCISSYPAPYEDLNLRAMKTLKDAFGLPVGFSDHSAGNQAAFAATALGAVAIEKHFTLDRNMAGPDHQASLEPAQMADLVQGVRIVHLALGSSRKTPAPCEVPNLPLIRKSLVAAADLEPGIKITREMIEIKRPLGGIEPGDLFKIIGRTIKHCIPADSFIHWEDLA